jgi:hypothetical protein
MKRKSVLWIVEFVLALGFVLLIPKLVTSYQTQVAQGMMSGGMMRVGMMGGGDMGTIRQLFANHNQVHRTIKEIPGGIHAVTESDNPQVSALIQSHVPRMYQRINDGQGIPMIMMSSTLPVMAQNADRYQRHLQLTRKGIVVTETSNDPDMVAVIREHAREVNRFVAEGMPAMMNNMMR